MGMLMVKWILQTDHVISVTVSKGIRLSCLSCLFSIISKCSLQACAIEPRPIKQSYWLLASEAYMSVCVVFICQRLLLVLHASPVSALTVEGALCMQTQSCWLTKGAGVANNRTEVLPYSMYISFNRCETGHRAADPEISSVYNVSMCPCKTFQ